MKGRKGRETGGVVVKDKKPEMVYAGAVQTSLKKQISTSAVVRLLAR